MCLRSRHARNVIKDFKNSYYELRNELIHSPCRAFGAKQRQYQEMMKSTDGSDLAIDLLPDYYSLRIDTIEASLPAYAHVMPERD